MESYKVLNEEERKKIVKLAKRSLDYWEGKDFHLAHRCIVNTEGWKLSTSSRFWITLSNKKAEIFFPIYLSYINPKTKGTCLARGAIRAITNTK